MSDLDVAASHAADEANTVVETNVVDAPNVADALDLPPAKSAGEAIDRAFERIEAESKVVQNRKPDGKFAKGKTEVPAEPAKTDAPPAPAYDVARLSNYGLSKEALAAAATADAKFLADIERRFTEMTKGLEEARPYKENWSKGQKYIERAKAAGRDIWEIVDQYVSTEDMLRDRPLDGFAHLSQRLGINPAELGQALVQMAQGQNYQAPQAQPQQFLTPEQARELARQEAEALYAERNALEEIQKFKAEHPRFEELQEDIAGMLAHPRIAALPVSEKLKAAYEAAERLNPAAPAVATPAAPQTPVVTPTPAAQPAPPAQAQTKAKANLSITGSPEGGSDPARRKKSSSVDEALESAFARVGI